MSPGSRHEVPSEVTIAHEAFRAAMRKRRMDLGLRQSDVSQAMGRSPDFVSVLENGVHTPNFVTMVLWASALGGTLGVDWQ